MMEKQSIKQTVPNDPFLQRAIEHWLDSSNELGYQPVFCELLISSGFTIKYQIKNTNFEQGKDVVAIEENGIPCGFQLKGGNISLHRWRTEVRPEIDSLIDIPIQHPEINKATPHISYLITNGEIEDAARSEIIGLNEGRWKKSPLRVWTRGDLLRGFLNMSNGVFPSNAEMYKTLIDLVFADGGTGLPNLHNLSLFLSSIMNINKSNRSKERRRRDIAGALLYTTMIAGPYREKKNHTSVVRIMTMLISYIFYIVDKHSLPDKYWINTYRIVWNDIVFTSRQLEKEVSDGIFKTTPTSPFDAELMRFRKYSAISIVYPLKLSELIANDEKWNTLFSTEILDQLKDSIFIWGEASLVLLIIISLIYKNVQELSELSNELIKNAVKKILDRNGKSSEGKVGLKPPYFDLENAAKDHFGLNENPPDDVCHRSSYLLKPLVEIIARRGLRKFLEDTWCDISFMNFEEVIPDDSTDYYLWRIEKAENRTTIVKKEQSWKMLVAQANSYKENMLPDTMVRFPSFLPFFLSTYPFRANSTILAFLDKHFNVP